MSFHVSISNTAGFIFNEQIDAVLYCNKSERPEDAFGICAPHLTKGMVLEKSLKSPKKTRKE